MGRSRRREGREEGGGIGGNRFGDSEGARE